MWNRPVCSLPPPPPARITGRFVCEWALPSALPLAYTIIELCRIEVPSASLRRGQLVEELAEVLHVELVDLGDHLQVFLVALVMRQIVMSAGDADLRDSGRLLPSCASISVAIRVESV